MDSHTTRRKAFWNTNTIVSPHFSTFEFRVALRSFDDRGVLSDQDEGGQIRGGWRTLWRPETVAEAWGDDELRYLLLGSGFGRLVALHAVVDLADSL